MAAAASTENRTKKSIPPTASSTADREIVVERLFDAPRELVWTAFTDPKHADRWWGPNGFRNETLSGEFRVGGTWKYLMHGPDGKAWPNWIRYEEISKPERLVYDHGAEEGGEPHFHVTITFATEGKRTKVTMRSVFPSAEAVAEVKKFGAVEGGEQTLARLTGYLPSMADGSAEGHMVLSRLFDAPAKLVFEAWSNAKALSRWWGPKHFTTEVECDFRVGGAYRMVMRDPSGNEYPFHGKYTAIVPNKRIEYTSIVNPPGLELTNVITFAEENGKTLVTVVQTIPANAMMAKGQRQGWSEQLEKLGAVLKAA